MVDATSDYSHVEQTTFIIRYLAKDDTKFAVPERFLTFVDCCKNMGAELANLIMETLKHFGVPIKDCRGQGYDNAPNTSGKYDVLSARLFSSGRPFAAHLSEIRLALKKLLSLNLMPKTTNEVNGVINYVSSFICILMSSMLQKILAQNDRKNQIVRARDATVDDEQGENVLENPCDGSDEPESEFKRNVFFVVIDSVINGVSKWFDSANTINRLFCVLWQYRSMTEEELKLARARLVDKYPDNLSESMHEEMENLKAIHASNFGEDMGPYQLLKTIKMYKLDGIFPNVCISLRIFCTFSATVASAERSFSKLKLIKSFLRNTMIQE
ncbi:uncharacterized protein LOC111086578 [Limulus polyphemus]|uniref:Uncharacterized protein LOC111086578 n=1 Tax=Limulus polyphemus TaxID=6850 RepID=A0ABM1SPU0_LIMPO|nr:uncharacterized protein LOC111086578 [Limulus polyphemus]